MQFLYPIGLLALAGLIIPLIIHLWNVKQGKTLKIGSIALLGESSRASSKSFRINDWLLLVLRCLLLVLLAFLLAQPYLKKTLSGKNTGGWILVDKSKFPQVFKDNRKTIDSLLKGGYDIHDFNAGFAQISLKDTAAIDSEKHTYTLSYTSLLSQVNNLVPVGSSVYLYADHRLINFGEELPAIAYKLYWNTLSQTDTLSSWIAEYAGKKYEGKSNPSNTSYQPLNSQDAPLITVAIYEASGSADSKYLVAALNAIGSFSKRRIEINPSVGKVDLGFWLSEEAVSSNFKSSIKANGNLFQYEKGKVVSEKSFINIDGSNIELIKRIASNHQAEKIWSDGFGNAILSNEKLNGLTIFHFYSRFNPQWNQLVWNDVFVKALMPIVISDRKSNDFGFEDNPADQRRSAANQKEIIQVNKTESSIKTTQNEPLGSIFWIAALLIFITERILSFRKKANVYVKS